MRESVTGHSSHSPRVERAANILRRNMVAKSRACLEKDGKSNGISYRLLRPFINRLDWG